MAKFILGKKLKMTQKFAADGTVIPVTVVSAGPCTVVQVKGEKDAYQAVQIGYDLKKKLNKSQAGHLQGLDNFRYLKEFRVNDSSSFSRGQIFGVDTFSAGDIIDARSVSKGKGFQGVVKRHGFAGSPATHGHKDQLRMPGSIGATDPARVFKGTRMAGRMGTDTVTLKNLEIAEVDPQANLIYIKGAIAGHRGSLVEIFCPSGEIKFLAKEEAKAAAVKSEEKTEETPTADKVEVDKMAKERTEEEKEAKPAPAKEETEVKESSDKQTKEGAATVKDKDK